MSKLRIVLALLAIAAAVSALLAWGQGREATGRELGLAQGRAEVRAVLDRERAEWAAVREAAAETTRLAARAARAEEQRRVAALQEALDAAEIEARREREGRAAADAAAAGLRERFAAAATAARFAACNPGLALGGPSAADPAGMLADVLGRCEARVRLLADVADQRGRAGKLCERAYDALTAPTAGSGQAPAAAAAGPSPIPPR